MHNAFVWIRISLCGNGFQYPCDEVFHVKFVAVLVCVICIVNDQHNDSADVLRPTQAWSYIWTLLLPPGESQTPLFCIAESNGFWQKGVIECYLTLLLRLLAFPLWQLLNCHINISRNFQRGTISFLMQNGYYREIISTVWVVTSLDSIIFATTPSSFKQASDWL